MRVFVKLLLCLFLSLTVILFCLGFYVFNVTSDCILDENTLKCEETTIYLDYCGNAISTDNNKNYSVKLEELPPHVKNAFIAIEDKRFYNHRGIDVKRIVGASLKNAKAFSFKEGASTISQQLIKNTHLSGEKTITRKLKEIKLTLALEKKMSKNQILQAYLNTIYFGEGSYGLANASEKFFGKPATELNIEESALLAGVIKSPSSYSPFRHTENATKRRNLVLDCMKEQGYISKHAYDNAVASPIKLSPKQNTSVSKAYLACVKSELEDILKSTAYSVYDNFEIHTYYNDTITQLLSTEITEQINNTNYSAILCDNDTHGICAFVSDCFMNARCPASTVKPWLVYAPSIEEKEITIATKILDEKTDFNGYSPSSYNGKYLGYVSVKEALIKSLNVPAVKLADCIGLKKLKQYARKMNVEINEGLGIALGALNDGMTIKQICDCYSVFSNKGEFEEYKFIKEIKNAKGKTIYTRKNNPKKVFNESTTYIINDTLYACVSEGTAKKMSDCNLPICAKTGTNGTKQGNHDAYTISYSPEFTLAVWLGNSDYSLMPNHISGGTYPAIISSEIWKNLDKISKITTFKIPESVIKAKIDEKEYEQNLTIFSGNGREFLFTIGTEPKQKNVSREIFNVKQNCLDGDYTLSYSLDGYDGVEVYNLKKGKRELVYSGSNILTLRLIENQKYEFEITPFYYNENKEKKYGDSIKLKPICYKKEPHAPSKWWADEE